MPPQGWFQLGGALSLTEELFTTFGHDSIFFLARVLGFGLRDQQRLVHVIKIVRRGDVAALRKEIIDPNAADQNGMTLIMIGNLSQCLCKHLSSSSLSRHPPLLHAY